MIKVFKDAQSTISALADFVTSLANDCIERKGRFTIALSGGSSPKALYELLASRGRVKDWSKVFFFFGDERNVAKDDPDSNFRMAQQSLFVPLEIPDEHVFPMNTDLSPAEAARDYEGVIARFFQPERPRFDLVLLGLGDNSHTASLFPFTDILKEKKALVKEVYVEELKKSRISLTAPIINSAHHVAFLVYGASKAEAVRHVLTDPEDTDRYPAQLIQPLEGEVLWFLDESAASLISRRA